MSGFSPSLKNDWSQTMGPGTSGTGGVYPAKYGFISTTYSCSDYVVFPTTVTGGSRVPPNIIAFNNLYTGCTGTVPNQYWAVAVHTGFTYGTVTTSPALSLDGEEVAFMENIGGSAYLVVVLMPTGNALGVDQITCPSSANVNSVSQTGVPQVWCAPIYGPATDGHSSPYVDYANNVLYVGDDNGVLHKFTNVFHSNGNMSVPSEAWHVTVSSGNALSSPVFDSGTSQKIFVGSAAGASSGGELHAVTTGGTLSATSGVYAVASTPGVYDGPLVDSTLETVYFVVGDVFFWSGYSGAFKFAADFDVAGISQVKFGTSTTSSIVYNGAFDAVYFAGTGTTGNFWVCATQGSGSPQLEGIPLTGGALNPPNYPINLTSAPATCSPVTEYYNSSDYLFMSVTANGNYPSASPLCSGSCVYSFTVSGTGNAPTKAAGLNATGGTSGIIIDNSVSGTGLSNIYYEDLGDTDAVQVSQSTL
jgi:hypothetical protein